MIQGDSLHTILCNFQQDFKAEIIAAEIAEQGIDPDQILLQMLGLLKRTYSNDVKVVETEILEDHKEYTIVKAAREGIYDMLPQSLFHHPTPHKSDRSEKEIIATMKRRREEELNARKFFLPFEATINHLRIEMALHENRLDKRAQYDDLVQLFAGHWEIFQYLNARQANIFLHLIPIVHDIRDNHAKIEEVLQLIFLLPVSISIRNELPSQPADSFLSVLGNGLLGVDLTTGNLLFDEGVDELHVKIGPVNNHAFNEFLPNAINRKILQMLIDYLLPVHVNVITEFELMHTNRMARLADMSGDCNALLGEDTYLT